MLGQLLEISIATGDVSESLSFFESLGFRSLAVGDTFSHHYAVVTDGTVFIGLHAKQFDSPALTYTRTGIAKLVRDFQQNGIEFIFSEIRDDVFNEAHFLSPEGLLLRLFEARTFSPPFEYLEPSLCGHFSELRLPTVDFDASVDFWESSGFVCLERADDPEPEAALTSDGLNLGLRDARHVRYPVLVFQHEEMPGRLEAIRDKGFRPTDVKGHDDVVELRAPGGTRLWLCQTEA